MYLGAASPNTFDIEVDSVYRMKIYGLARTSTNLVKEFEGVGLVKNDGGTTALVGGPITLVSTLSDVGLTLLDIDVFASDLNDFVFLLAHGIAATTINWYVKIDYIKIS